MSNSFTTYCFIKILSTQTLSNVENNIFKASFSVRDYHHSSDIP
jgi:hypothetical protein